MSYDCIMKRFQTPEQVESAVKNGEKVYWHNQKYRVIFDGSQFLIVYNMGGSGENSVGLYWLDYQASEFFSE